MARATDDDDDPGQDGMDGGMVIDVASGLGADGSDLVKAVVAIAPWNGVQPTPSSVVKSLSAPLLIFCSMCFVRTLKNAPCENDFVA